MNKKILITMLFFGISINAEYSTEKAGILARRILGAGLIEHVESRNSDLFDIRTAEGQELSNLVDSLTTEEEFQIRKLAECFRLDENNLHRVRAFLEQIIPVFENNGYDAISIIPTSKKINKTSFYTQILPIIQENNEAALILLKEFAFNFEPGNSLVSEKKRFKFFAVMLDILMDERDDSSLATAFFFDFYSIMHRTFYEEVRNLDDKAELSTLETAIKAVTLKMQKNAQQKLDFDPTLSTSGRARYDARYDVWLPVDA